MVAGVFLRTKSAVEAREAEIADVYRSALSRALSAWLEERKNDIAILTRFLELEGPAVLDPVSSSAAERFRSLLESKAAFSDILLIGLDGYVLSNRVGAASRPVYLGDRDYFLAARAGGDFITGVFQNRLTGLDVFALSRPLRFKERVAAVVAGTVLVSDLARIVEGLSLKDLGSVYIIDSDRRLVMSSARSVEDPEEGPPPESAALSNFAAREVVAGGAGAGKYTNEDGTLVVGAYGWFPELALGLIVELRSDHALLPITRLLVFFTEFAAGLLLLQLALAYILSARLVRPIRILAEAARTLESRKNPKIQIGRTNTELDTLIDAFNSMAHSIHDREALLRENASRDSLTGLYNHAKIEEFLDFELKRKRRDKGPVCFVMMDIDHFKIVNDTYGHQAGDTVLKDFARLLREAGREGDVIGRYGGEEFAVILNSRTARETEAYCERIRKMVEAATFIHEGKPIRVTLSLGFAVSQPATRGPFEIVRAADKALYAAKSRGRNRVEAGTTD